MSEFAFTVVEPNGRQSAQLLDVMVPVAEIVRRLVALLGWPEELHYRLVSDATGEELEGGVALAAAGVGPGEVLHLEVIRDAWLKKLLDRLRDEARDYARDQVWDMVQERLDRIESIEPDYPGLEDLRGGIGSSPAAPLPPAKTSPAGVGGCFVLLAVGAVIAVATQWKPISGWVKKLWGTHEPVKGAEGTISAGAGGRIEIVDHNSVLDFAYRLYLNGKLVGDVRNPAGGTTSYPVTFAEGRNLVELRYLDGNAARDTRLIIRINAGEFAREFSDNGTGERKSFQWLLEGMRK